MSSVVQQTQPTGAKPEPGARRIAGHLAHHAERWGFVALFLVVIAVFGIARPSTFLTWDNARSILDAAAPLALIAIGITVVLLLGEFDLSVGYVAQAAAAAGVVAMSNAHLGTFMAVVIALATGLAAGLINGVSVAYFRIPSFIATLAVGSLAMGFELALAKTSIFQGISPSYASIGRSELFGAVPMTVVIALGVAIVFAVLLRATVFGRQATAIGENAAAATLAGVPVRYVRVAGLALAGLTAAMAGILLSAKASSYYPGLGIGFVLPAYAAAFLGLSLGGGWRFNVLGTVLGVVFLGTITTGLVMMNQPAWLSSMIQGALLLISIVVLARRTGGLFK